MLHHDSPKPEASPNTDTTDETQRKSESRRMALIVASNYFYFTGDTDNLSESAKNSKEETGGRLQHPCKDAAKWYGLLTGKRSLE